MKEENLVHIRLDYEEALESKRDILSCERDFLNVLKIMRRYKILRQRELENQIKTYDKIKELKLHLTKMHNVLPKVKIPNILKKKDIFEDEKENKKIKHLKIDTKVKKTADEDELEKQLRDIQDRLGRLG